MTSTNLVLTLNGLKVGREYYLGKTALTRIISTFKRVRFPTTYQISRQWWVVEEVIIFLRAISKIQ